MLTNGNIPNTSKNHQNIALNKDDDIGDSQIPFMSKCISITIPLAKQVQNVCMSSSFIHFLELLMLEFQ